MFVNPNDGSIKNMYHSFLLKYFKFYFWLLLPFYWLSDVKTSRQMQLMRRKMLPFSMLWSHSRSCFGVCVLLLFVVVYIFVYYLHVSTNSYHYHRQTGTLTSMKIWSCFMNLGQLLSCLKRSEPKDTGIYYITALFKEIEVNTFEQTEDHRVCFKNIYSG